MAESSSRKVGWIKEDRISLLPRNIQEIILCFLPLRDAVRTSILSRNWRHCWTTIPDVFIDELILMQNIYIDDLIKANKIGCVIDKVLALHNGPILRFSLSIPSQTQIIFDYLDKWIPLLSRKGIKQFTVEGQDWEEFKAHNFSSLNLTHLRLSWVCFPYVSASGGFTYMRIIELIGVTTKEDGIFDCPVLQKLTLLYNEGLSHANFRAPNLKYLHEHYRDNIFEYSLEGLENLKEYSYRWSGDPETQPGLETPNVVNVLSSLCKIKKLSIAMYFIKYLAAGGSPNRLSKPLPYLKTLSIFDINLTRFSEVSCLLCLIRSAPNLCKLHISSDLSSEEENLEDYCEEDYGDCTVDHLQIVTFSFFKGLKAELELVRFLLAHSPELKTMFIHRYYMEKDAAALKIAEEMLEFSRVSSRAQIRSLKCPIFKVDYGPWLRDWGTSDAA